MLLSIIIPAYNEAALIGDSISEIQSELKQAFDSEQWELIVCDNASLDETVDIASALGAKVVAEPVHQISKVRNRGASLAQGKFLLFVDADSFPSAGLFAEMKKEMLKKDCLGLGAIIEVQGGSLWNKLRMERLNPLMKLFRYSWGAFILCQRIDFEAIGGFSEDLFALEEIDFVRRLKKEGRKKKQRFRLLEKPVITSGRKDEINPKAVFHLFLSNTLAVLLLFLNSILPKHLRRKANPKLFRFWYGRRN